MSGLTSRQDSTERRTDAGARRNVDRVRLRIDTSRAPRRQFTADGRLMHVDYCATMGFGDVVQEYDDGAEFRPKEEVTEAEAMASFVGLIFTDEHPDDGVDVDNATQVNRGHILSTFAAGPDMCGWIRVVDGRTIERIDGGKDKLSCGYDLRTDNTPGEFNGVPYQRIQRRIRGNHVALTGAPRGERGTDNPRIHFDSSKGAQHQMRVQKDSTVKKIKIKLPDGREVEVEVDENVAAYIASLEAPGQVPPPPGNAAPPGSPPAAPPTDDSDKTPPPVAPRADAKPLTVADVDARLDARLREVETQRRQDSLEYGRFHDDAAAVLRLDSKSYMFTGDLATDRIGVAEVLLGDKDVDVVAAKTGLSSRSDSKIAEARAGAGGLYKAAAIAARARHDKTGEQLAGLAAPRHDSNDVTSVDAVLAAGSRGFRPAAASAS